MLILGSQAKLSEAFWGQVKKATDQSEFWIWGPRTVYSSTIHKYMCPKVRLNIFLKCIFPVFKVFFIHFSERCSGWTSRRTRSLPSLDWCTSWPPTAASGFEPWSGEFVLPYTWYTTVDIVSNLLQSWACDRCLPPLCQNYDKSDHLFTLKGQCREKCFQTETVGCSYTRSYWCVGSKFL